MTPKIGRLTKFHGAVPQVDDPQLQIYVNAMAKRRADNRRKKRKGLQVKDPPLEFKPLPNPPDDRPPMAIMPRELAAQTMPPEQLAAMEEQRIVAERLAKKAQIQRQAVVYRGRKR